MRRRPARIAGWLPLLLAACGSAPPAAPSPAAPAVPDVVAGGADATPTAAANGNLVLTLPNHLSVVNMATTPDAAGFATLGLGIACGTVHGKQGLADIAAYTFANAGDGGSGRQSLQQAIAALGGDLSTEVGRVSTWFYARVPQPRWQEALTALTGALTARTSSRTQLERLLDEMVRQRAQSIWNEFRRNVAARFLLGDAGSGAFIAALLQRDPSEIALFQARYYRPEGTVLALRIGAEASLAAAPALLQLGQWQLPPSTPDPDAGQRDRMPEGLYWAESPGDSCRVLLLLPYPDPLAPEAAAQHVLLNCLSMDGIGGRLELLQQRAGLGDLAWQGQFVQCGDAAGLLLSTTTTAARALQLHELVQTARQSLLDTPPSSSEFELAMQRAALTGARCGIDADQWMREVCMRTLRAIPADLNERLQALRAPSTPAFAAAAKTWLQQPMLFAVLGGTPPASAPPTHEFELLPEAALGRLTGADQATLARTADPLLDAAIEAAGGRDRLRLYGGCSGKSQSRAAEAPVVDQEFEWHRDGRLRLQRTVLDTAITTSIGPDGGKEGTDDSLQPLTPAECAARTRGFARHPLALLAAHARGELRCQWIASRRLGDRNMLIVEATSKDYDRLRLSIDEDSSLIRTVETWDTTADGTPVYVQESYSDYRSVMGLRVPFRRMTDLDDGSRRIETVWSSFTPLWATP